MSRIGIVVGMRAEADCLAAAVRAFPEPQRPELYCAGANAERALQGARALADRGVVGLLSIGIAGGLVGHLAPGDLVVADAVLDRQGGRWSTTQTWRTGVAGDLSAATVGTIIATPHPVHSPQEKAALHQRYGALAVDMESASVAAAAADAGLPFLALRVIADPVTRAVPSTALQGLGPDGERRPLAVLRGLLFQPWEMLPLIRVARDSKRALDRLRGVAALSHGLFAGPFG